MQITVELDSPVLH